MERLRRLYGPATLGLIFAIPITSVCRAQDEPQGQTQSVIILQEGDGEPRVISGGLDSLPEELRATMKDVVTQRQQMAVKFNGSALRVTPNALTVDPSTRAATFELSNDSDDTLTISLTPSRRSHPAIPGGVQFNINGNKGLPTQVLQAMAGDSVLPTHSLVGWIKDLPARVQLAPHQKRSVTVHFTVPANARPGSYGGWILAQSEVQQPAQPASPENQESETDDQAQPAPPRPIHFQMSTLQSAIKLQYQVERAR